MKILITILFCAILFPKMVFAIDVPDYPICTNPTGSLKVQYDLGLHAIAGENTLREGSDKVYWLENGNALQCFCPVEGGNGIQTNWLKILGISDQEKQSFVSSGWLYVAKGLDWGLDASPYLARNISYDCKPVLTPSPTAVPTASPSQTVTPDSQGSIGGGGTRSVLGLAATGDNASYVALICLGLAFISGGLLLRKH
jgi:hypothetical protein